MFSRIIITLLLVGLSMPYAGGQWATLEGEALDLETDRLVYRERHSLAPNEQGHWVMESDYLGPDGSLWAERTVQFHQGQPERPSYRLVDHRDGFEEGAERLADGSIELYRTINGERESVTIRPANQRPLVVDAGFSALIAEQWDALLEGERVTFDFASAARLTTIQFRLMHEPELNPTDQVQFVLEPANWFVRMLVSPIKLSYRRNDKALMSYEGLSNIRQLGGGNHKVVIRFPSDHHFTIRQLPSG